MPDQREEEQLRKAWDEAVFTKLARTMTERDRAYATLHEIRAHAVAARGPVGSDYLLARTREGLGER